MRIAIEVVHDPAGAELVLSDAASTAAFVDLDLGQHRRDLGGQHQLGQVATRSAGSVVASLPSSEVRNSETISTESTPATRPWLSTTGPYCVSDWSRSESASRSTSSSSMIGYGAASGVAGTVAPA